MTELSPDMTLRMAAGELTQRAAAARTDLANNPYWDSALHTTPQAAYPHGVRNGLGGAAGELAAALTPDVAEALSAWFIQHADHLLTTHQLTDPATSTALNTTPPVRAARALLATRSPHALP